LEMRIFMFVVIGLLVASATPGPVASVQVRGVQVELRLGKAEFRGGESVEITLTFTNPGGSPVTFQFPTGQIFDLIVSRDGNVVWRWSSGRVFTQAFGTFTLIPNESKVFRELWDQRETQGRRVAPGVYEMVAVFPAGVGGVVVPGRRENARVRFAILGASR
jgi:intracellular proteinase inhibitor BsuPI